MKSQHWSKLSYFHGASNDPLLPQTIGKVFEDVVKEAPDREYLISRHENKTLTYADMHAEVEKLCRSFSAIGLNYGDRIAVWMPNCALYVSVIIAAARLGLVLVNINPAYQSDELQHSLQLVGVKCLLTFESFNTQNYPAIIETIDPDIWNRPPNTRVVSKQLPTLETVVFNTENTMRGAYNLQSFLDLGAGKEYEVPNVQPDEGCNIPFTSGTTGKPKAVLLNHFGLLNNARNVMKRLGILDDQNTVHKFCCTMPLFHAVGLSVGVLGAMVSKSTCILPSANYDLKSTVDAIIINKATVFFGTPFLFVDVSLYFETLAEAQKENDLRLAITGGAPCSPDLMKKFKLQFPRAKLMPVYGMTETSPCTFQNFSHDSEDKLLNTVGFIHDHVEAKVVDSKGHMVPFGTPGELLIRGYVNMTGYYNDPEKTKETIDSSGWLHTGDQFVLYEDGYGNLAGRVKEIIIRGGENIFPKEIEYFLETHPAITQAEVYGIPDDSVGEEICASIILKDGMTVKEEDIKLYAKGKISQLKIPKHIIVEKSFPKTGSGKAQKFKLREMAVQRISEMYLK
ncbi:medium-chain acyl-CoA ligase ACSF2, mitochondrial-like [Adelges cooleyi]|uniref:medium-chain acyl-CoA ligase ACSF2, mitochondrial-like n=1 Tax=Adelges cooleyi TaxID=133065 RepID=UPI00217FE916|nr:medium-chain acyl-CoA ligase ACSF2, mitochondrial-like [Adelges cooleyi]XP_050428076.1 medium-chain acyl-CoA ligase ACSF2, mitochondrial-like [Adelges cooleyi]XP_050428077.1 medium-chain acyl-CoA ligase ACSF2, mitochondrial-like [Adelges cooleyi]